IVDRLVEEVRLFLLLAGRRVVIGNNVVDFVFVSAILVFCPVDGEAIIKLVPFAEPDGEPHSSESGILGPADGILAWIDPVMLGCGKSLEFQIEFCPDQGQRLTHGQRIACFFRLDTRLRGLEVVQEWSQTPVSRSEEEKLNHLPQGAISDLSYIDDGLRSAGSGPPADGISLRLHVSQHPSIGGINEKIAVE